MINTAMNFLKTAKVPFNIGGTKIRITKFLLLISILLIGERFLWEEKGISIVFLCFSVPLSLCAQLVSTMLSGTRAPIQQILKHTCNIPASIRLSMCLDDFGSGS